MRYVCDDICDICDDLCNMFVMIYEAIRLFVMIYVIRLMIYANVDFDNDNDDNDDNNDSDKNNDDKPICLQPYRRYIR